MATDQPRDLAREVGGIDLAVEHQRIRRDHEQWYHTKQMYEVPMHEWREHEVSIHRLLDFIASQSRELELQLEALRECLESGVGQSYASETGFATLGGEVAYEPPAHLLPVLAKALEGK